MKIMNYPKKYKGGRSKKMEYISACLIALAIPAAIVAIIYKGKKDID